MDEYKLRTEQMTVGYRGVPLIRDISIRVRKGEILTLIGPNGAGKSTILKSIIRQLALLGGTVYLDGRSMRDISEREVARSMSVLMTERIRPELMTCGDVVATGRYPYTGRMGILSAEDRKKVREANITHVRVLWLHLPPTKTGFFHQHIRIPSRFPRYVPRSGGPGSQRWA